MKIVITGGTGHIGKDLIPRFVRDGHIVTVLSRAQGGAVDFGLPEGVTTAVWDGRSVGDWATTVDGADVVINMAGRSVDCRYSEENLRQMMASRVESTRAIGQAIAIANEPPRVWLQMSTATIYAHRFDAQNDEATGVIGGRELDVPAYWKRSIDIARAWEGELEAADTPRTRKVALRTAMVMNSVPGSVFRVLSRLVRLRLGGRIGSGRQYISWIHADDFHAALEYLMSNESMAGAVNLAAPGPLPQAEFMAALRRAWGVRIGLPAAKWMSEVGAFVLRSDTELLHKSRRVVPGRLLESGFQFRFPSWETAAKDLVKQCR